MELLATIKPEDVDAGSPLFEYEAFKPRAAGRAIVFDSEKVALIHVTEYEYYTLPGGGIENDNLQTGLAREILEELGCKIEITGEVGSTTVYFDRWQQKQTDYCYMAQKTVESQAVNPTDFEIEEGYKVVWVSSLEEAIKLVRNAPPKNRDGKLVRARDTFFAIRSNNLIFTHTNPRIFINSFGSDSFVRMGINHAPIVARKKISKRDL